jgi:hypothetical protein
VTKSLSAVFKNLSKITSSLLKGHFEKYNNDHQIVYATADIILHVIKTKVLPSPLGNTPSNENKSDGRFLFAFLFR